jgi:hypothetical protein
MGKSQAGFGAHHLVLHETPWCGRAKKSLAADRKTVNFSGLKRLTHGHSSTAMHVKAFTEFITGMGGTKSNVTRQANAAPTPISDSSFREIRPGQIEMGQVSAEKVDSIASLSSELIGPTHDRLAAILCRGLPYP